MADQVRGLDLTNAFAPAISTTSDMPIVAPPAEIEPHRAVPEANDEPEIKAAENAGAAAEARAAMLAARLEKALTVLDKAPTRTESTVKTEPAEPHPRRPLRQDFAYSHEHDAALEKYDEDLVAWSAKASAKLTQAELERKSKDETEARGKAYRDENHRASFKERTDAWGDAKAKAIEKYADYLEVAEDPKLQITPAMGLAILEDNLDGGKGFEITYYLGKHPEEAAKIAALPTIERQQLAIGRLAERLASQPAKAARSRSPADKKSPDNEGMEEYAARRNRELRAYAP
jgi:hypothetical protein